MKNRLKAIMVLKGDTNKALAEQLGITASALSSKINGKRKFSLDEAKFIMDKYSLTPEETVELFLGQ